MTSVSSLAETLSNASVIISCGAGGVGKTTTSAVLAIAAAERGRNVALVTIDPARRLADALGISTLTNTPTEIDGPWPGQLSALMLDTKNTFDALIDRYAPSPAQRDRILANPFYRNISGTLSGTQEYMAAEKLYELHDTTEFDLVVVDTPPTRNALDFLDAPDRLSRFLNHPLYRLMTAPTRGLVKAVNFATQTALKSMTKVVGGDVIADAIAFFQAFDGMEEGFRQRSTRVRDLLIDDTTSYVLVTSPKAETLDEAHFFADRLQRDDIAISALIVNRMHPHFPLASSASDVPNSTEVAESAVCDLDVAASLDHDHPDNALSAYYRCRAQFRSVAAQEIAAVEDLRTSMPGVGTYLIPFMVEDVHDLESLKNLATHLVG